MAILNYSTTVSAFKTANDIEEILMNHKAKSIMKNYEDGSIVGLSFLIDTGVQQREKRESPKKGIKTTREQAERVAWRIMKDWVEAQMALLDIEMVRFEEIFLPYIETRTGQTVFECLEERQFLLEV